MSELRRLVLSGRFIFAGMIVFLPALLLWSMVVYYGSIYLSGQWFPVQPQSVVDSMTFDQRIIYLKQLFWWMMGFTGIALISIRLISPIAKLDGLILRVASPAYVRPLIEYGRLAKKRDREQGPAEVRLARRRLERWESQPKRFDSFYRFSMWRLFGKSKEWVFEHYTKAAREWTP